MNYMSEKNENPNKPVYQKNDFYLLSSWNYGSYSPTNPYYKACLKYKKYNTKTNPNHPQTKTKSNFIYEKITEKNRKRWIWKSLESFIQKNKKNICNEKNV